MKLLRTLSISVNRNFYHFALVFLAIQVVITTIQGFVYFQLGPQSYTLQSFFSWFNLANIVNLVSLLVLLRYYRFKQFRITFLASILVIIATLLHFLVVFSILSTRELEGFFIYSFLLSMIITAFYSISLIFSTAGKRPWLKTAGVLGLVLSLTLICTFIGYLSTRDLQIKTQIDRILNWISLVGGIIFPTLYAMNFLSEIKELQAEESEHAGFTVPNGVIVIIGIIALISITILSTNLLSQSSKLLAWQNRGPERAMQLAEPFEARIHLSAEKDTVRYRLLMPLNYDSTKQYPLVVCLHGGGGWGTDNLKQIEGSWAAQILAEYHNREEFQSFVFVPQCPPGRSWGGGLANLPGIDTLIFETIDVLEQEYSIDPKRRYVIGASLGGYGSWSFIQARSEVFAAAVPICGGGDPTLAHKLVDIPLWVFHGAKDRSVPVKLSRDMIKAIKDAGGNPRYSEFPDQGHIIYESVRNTPDLLAWMFNQKRD